ncbi:MAG: hypothetical protein QXF56_00050 [Candidatus Micrarchaeia archaeon]
MVVVQKNKQEQEYKIIVSISSSQNSEFTKKLSEELRANRFSVMHNQTANTVEGRTKNLIFAVNHAADRANMVVCVNCRTPESAKETRLEKSEKGGFKPHVNVLSRQLLEATALCSDIACVNKFPGEVERPVSELIEELHEKGIRRVSLDVLDKKLREKKKEDSATYHWMRRALREFSGDKAVVEIEVFPRNSEETATAVSESVEIIKRLHEFNSKKKESFGDSRLFANAPQIKHS